MCDFISENDYYIDKKGYPRFKNNNHEFGWRSRQLVHRYIAYHFVYEENRELYPLGFSQYIVHHKNKNKRDFDEENLDVMERDEHIEEHEANHKTETRIKLTIKPRSSLKKIILLFRFLYQEKKIIGKVIAGLMILLVLGVAINFLDNLPNSQIIPPENNQTNNPLSTNQNSLPKSINAEAFNNPLGYLQTTGLPDQTNQCFNQECMDSAVNSCGVGTIYIMEGKTQYRSNLYDTKVYSMIYAKKDNSCLLYQQIHNLTVGGDVMIKQVFTFINGKPQGNPIKFASQITLVPNQPELFPKQ